MEQTSEVHFSVAKTEPDFGTYEVVFASSKSIKNFAQQFAKKRKWNPAIQNQLEHKLKNLAVEDEGEETKKFVHLRVHFEQGTECRFIFLKEGISTYDLHSILRECLSDLFKADSPAEVFFNLRSVGKSLQTKVLDAVSALSVLNQWKAPKKSKRKDIEKLYRSKVIILSDLSKSDITGLVFRGKTLGLANNLVRRLSDLPSNFLTPKNYVQEIETRAKEKKYRFEFYDRTRLTKMGAGAFLAVTQASSKDFGGIVHLKYSPFKKSKKIVLVGKGVCFDTGGYNIKVKHMNGMHKDMTGSAVALATFETLVAMKVKFEVHAVLAIADNLISPEAYRPNDVVTAMDGTTIEVSDTDAEGRMILSDALVIARNEKPSLLIDYATLTGAAVNAIDTRRSAIFGQPASLLKLGSECGESSGERTWAFPIGDDYREQLKSDIADILQCRAESAGDHIYAASFLHHFVGKETPWLHMDLSSAENKGGLGLVSSLSTGFGVRWSIEVIEKYMKGSK